MSAWRTAWVQEKQDIALRLYEGQCGGSYGEAVILLCAAISALAAEVWPGRANDRARFVELLREFAPPSLNVERISVPLLAGFLRKEHKPGDLNVLRSTFLNYSASRILGGDEADRTENDVLKALPSLGVIRIRQCSYANLLYTELRSGYAHEYRPGDRADSWPMTRKPGEAVSYVNVVREIDRRIHFHIHWVSEVAYEIAKRVDAANATIPRNKAHPWWIDGA